MTLSSVHPANVVFSSIYCSLILLNATLKDGLSTNKVQIVAAMYVFSVHYNACFRVSSFHFRGQPATRFAIEYVWLSAKKVIIMSQDHKNVHRRPQI